MWQETANGAIENTNYNPLNKTTNSLDVAATANPSNVALFNANNNPLGNGNGSAIDPSKYSSATDLAAAVAQGQYDNWKAQYYPIMLAARDMTTYADPSIIDTEIGKGTAIANASVDNAAQQQKLAFDRMGITPDGTSQAAIGRSNDMGKSTAVVDAANRIRQGLIDRNKSIMATNVSSFKSTI